MTQESNDPNDPIGAIPIAGESPPGPARPTRASSQDRPQEAVPPNRLPPRPRKHRRFSTVAYKSGLGALVLLVLYLLASLVVFPLTAPRQLSQYLEKRLDRPVTIPRAEWRPWAGRLVLHNGIIGPRKADPYDRVDPLLSFRIMELRPTMAGLLGLAPLFSSLMVEQGYVHLVRKAEQGYNLPLPYLLDSRLFPARLEIRHSRLEYTDRRHQPIFNGIINNLDGTLSGTQRGGERYFTINGQGPGESRLELQATLLPGAPGESRSELKVQRLPLSALGAYLEPLLGIPVSRGELAGQWELRRYDRQLQIRQRLTINDLELKRMDGTPETMPLLQALLTDRQQQIRLEQSFDLQPEHHALPYLAALAAEISELRQAAAKPGELLARQLPELAIGAAISFAPGRHELSREAGRSLDQLAAALGHRPLLALELQGISDPACDGEALRLGKEQQQQEQRRRAVAELARQLAGQRQPDAPATTDPTTPRDLLRLTSPEVSREELLALAARRQESARQRLMAALAGEDSSRLDAIPPLVQAAPDQGGVTEHPGETSCKAMVKFHFRHYQR